MPKVILGVKLYSVNETAELLGVTYQTAQKYISEGKIEAQTIGGRRFVSEDKLKLFLQGN